jgi:hypothetical protein
LTRCSNQRECFVSLICSAQLVGGSFRRICILGTVHISLGSIGGFFLHKRNPTNRRLQGDIMPTWFNQYYEMNDYIYERRLLLYTEKGRMILTLELISIIKKGYSLFSVLIIVNIRILYCQCFISLSLDLIITIPQKIITSYNLI